MSEGGIHNPGTTSLIPSHTIATFPTGTFLENIAVRSNGTLLVSAMTSGEIFLLDPHASDPQSSILKLHDFNDGFSGELEEESATGGYGTKRNAEALVEDIWTEDVFYTFSGVHGKAGTWGIFRLDLRGFSQDNPKIEVEKVAEVPRAIWLNGGTMLPNGILLMAESAQGQLIGYNLSTHAVSIWLQDSLLGKVTSRPEWPAINGVQFFRGSVFATVSDRGVLVKMDVDEDGMYKDGSIIVVAEDITGDDLAFDVEGNAYVATNPAQSLMKLSGVGVGVKGGKMTIVGGEGIAETAGPTAVAFGRTDEDRECIYVTTTGGIVRPVGEGHGVARIVRADVGVRREE